MDVKKVEKSVDVFDKFQSRVMEFIRLTNMYNTFLQIPELEQKKGIL